MKMMDFMRLKRKDYRDVPGLDPLPVFQEDEVDEKMGTIESREIEILKEDVESAVVRNCMYCPVALAVCLTVGGSNDIFVFPDSIDILSFSGERWRSVSNPFWSYILDVDGLDIDDTERQMTQFVLPEKTQVEFRFEAYE